MLKWDLTFDMSGGPKGAKRPLERPLDGRVRPPFLSRDRSVRRLGHDRLFSSLTNSLSERPPHTAIAEIVEPVQK